MTEPDEAVEAQADDTATTEDVAEEATSPENGE